MIDKKVSSWGITPDEEEETMRENIEKGVGQSAARQGYFDSSLLSIFAALTEEVRMIRCHLTGVEYEPLFSAEDLEYEEDEPFDETRDVIPSSIPRNLNSEREIQDFYKSQLVPLMSDREAGNLEIMVEEDQVILKTGFVDRDRYGPLSAKLRDLGGDYIREEGNWHWIMPLP